MLPTRLINQDRNLFNHFLNNDVFNPDFSTTNTTLPSINIKETEDKFEVELAAPGFDKKDFNIELNNRELSISSEKKEENEQDEGMRYTRREFSYQSFKRTFTLPNTIASDQISAKYKDGVLRVEIPKLEEAKPKPPKQIAIK